MSLLVSKTLHPRSNSTSKSSAKRFRCSSSARALKASKRYSYRVMLAPLLPVKRITV